MKANPQFFNVLMRKILLTLGVSLILSSAAIFSRAAGTGTTQLSGHVPAVVSRLQAKGSLSTTAEINLAIGLPLRNTESLTNLLRQLYDPTSPNYHQYLTPEQFTSRFGPTEADYQKVVDFAKASGLVVTGVHPNRMLLDVRGKVADIQNAFHVTLRTYAHPTEARDFFAPDTEPSVAAELPITHVSGLENYYTARPRLKPRPASQPSVAPSIGGATPGATPAAGSAPGGNYEGSDFRNAYVPGTALTGAGQNVGLFQLDGYYPSDIAAYENQIGLTSNIPQLVTVPVDGGVPAPTPFGNPEVSLDIEMVLSMSPGVSTIYVYEGPNNSATSIYTIFEDVFNRMANDNLAKQLSCSWYIVDGVADPVSEQIFQQMAVEGQSLFCASGDSDAYTGFIAFPSDSPHLTLVGGTTLTTRRNAGYLSETVWNWDIEYGPIEDGIGSSGGISSNYKIPSWQTNVNMSANGGSKVARNVPDVALTGDAVWVLYGSGQSGSFGGTSCAAPLWAGFTALVNQQGAGLGNAPIGFINPAIYAIANSTNYANCFHDITTGNNTWSGSPNLFFATPNYDLCTGLGTPNGTNLINALAATANTVTHISAPSPPYGTTLSVLNGGNPNGTWELFVQDVSPLDTGIISNGWSLALTTANPVGFAADSGLTMTASSTNVLVGSNVVCYLTVTNYGPSSSTNVIVSDTLPSTLGVVLVSSNATLGTITRNGLTIVWNVGNLAISNGAAMTLTFQSSVPVSFPNLASVSSTTSDPNPADDQASVNINVGALQPPQLTGSVVGSGHQFQFSITDPAQVAYVILASTNLLTGPWVPIYTNPAPATVTTTFTDPNSGNYPVRFYRVLLQ
jgi:uncharacterized repeat protein (TIGR01451 family)